MEGNRHEKVAIALLAYVIGFTTAFIAFGLSKMPTQIAVVPQKEQIVQLEKKDQPYAVADLTMGMDDEGLFVVTDGAKRYLSINKSSLSANAIASTPVAGIYESIVDAKVSPDGKFAYYCEQLDASLETCDPYIYSFSDDVLYPVTVDGGKYVPTVADHIMTWFGESTVVFDGLSSVDPLMPWKLETHSVEASLQNETEDPEEGSETESAVQDEVVDPEEVEVTE